MRAQPASRSYYNREKMAAPSPTAEDCEDYIEKHGIQTLLKDCIAAICQERPDNPQKWLADYFTKLEKVNEIVDALHERNGCVLWMPKMARKLAPLSGHPSFFLQWV